MAKGFFKSDEDASLEKISELKKETENLNRNTGRTDLRETDTLNKKWDDISIEDHQTPCQCAMQDGDKVLRCNRHECLKTPSLHHLCKTRMDYFRLWEEGVGPGQDPIMKHSFVNNYPVTKEQILKRKKEWQEELNGMVEINDKNQQERLDSEEQNRTEEEYKKGFFMGDIDIPLESRGLGDTVAKITKATGIKKVVDTAFGVFNKDCGCIEKQNKLNSLFPYGKRKKTKGFFE